MSARQQLLARLGQVDIATSGRYVRARTGAARIVEGFVGAMSDPPVRYLVPLALWLAAAVAISLIEGTPDRVPSVALGSTVLLHALRAGALFAIGLIAATVLARAGAGRLPTQLTTSGIGYDAEETRDNDRAGRAARTGRRSASRARSPRRATRRPRAEVLDLETTWPSSPAFTMSDSALRARSFVSFANVTHHAARACCAASSGCARSLTPSADAAETECRSRGVELLREGVGGVRS